MTTYSAAPPTRSVKAERRDAMDGGSMGGDSMDRAAAISVRSLATSSARSPPPCGEGSGVGVGVITRAASANCYPSAHLRRRADHAFHQIVHLLELGVGLAAFDAGGDHRVALVVLERALEGDVAAGHALGLDVVGMLAPGFRDLRPIGRDLDDAFLEAATVEVRDAFALDVHLYEAWIEHLPVPLGAGEVSLRSESRRVDVIARHH